MKNALLLAGCLFLLQCKEDMDCGPVIEQPPVTIDTLDMHTLEALENGRKIVWHARMDWVGNYEFQRWGFGTNRLFFYYNPNEDFGGYFIPFKKGIFPLKQLITLPVTDAVTAFSLTEWDTVYEKYSPDSTKSNFIKVDFIDSTTLEVSGTFEANFVVVQPKREAASPDSVSFKKGRFRFKI